MPSDWQILKVPFDSGGIDRSLCYALAYYFVHQLFTVHILSVLLFSLPYYIIISSSIDHLHTYKRLELSSLPLYSIFMLIKFQITTVKGITINTLFMLSLYLSIYIFQLNSIIIIVLQLFFSLTPPVIMRSHNLHYGHP